MNYPENIVLTVRASYDCSGRDPAMLPQSYLAQKNAVVYFPPPATRRDPRYLVDASRRGAADRGAPHLDARKGRSMNTEKHEYQGYLADDGCTVEFLCPNQRPRLKFDGQAWTRFGQPILAGSPDEAFTIFARLHGADEREPNPEYIGI